MAEWERYRRIMCRQAPAVLQLLLARFRGCHYLQVSVCLCVCVSVSVCLSVCVSV